MNDIRMRELAEKFASELKNRLTDAELLDVALELDLSQDEAEYFGLLDDEEEQFGCDYCPYYYADCYDEDDMFEDGCCYCHYDGPDNQAPCADAEYEEVDDYESNSFCDNHGFCGGQSCSNFYQCHA